MIHDLLPASSEAPRCSEFARSLAASPVGTGLFLERVILVAVPLPWPKPAVGHELLKAANKHVTGSAVASRLFAAEPWAEHDAGEVLVEVYERVGLEVRVATTRVADAGLESEMERIASIPLGELDGEPLDGSVMLVCTQGSHDICCGVDGVVFADELARERPEVGLRRVSHTGGHRYAPTLLALPDLRMWAFADLDLVDRIVAGAVEDADLARRCRGSLVARVGPSQVAENAVRMAVGELAAAPQIDVTEIEPASRFACTVRVADRAWWVAVDVSRDIPTIACEAAGGLPSKLGREFAWGEPVEVLPVAEGVA